MLNNFKQKSYVYTFTSYMPTKSFDEKINLSFGLCKLCTYVLVCVIILSSKFPRSSGGSLPAGLPIDEEFLLAKHQIHSFEFEVTHKNENAKRTNKFSAESVLNQHARATTVPRRPGTSPTTPTGARRRTGGHRAADQTLEGFLILV
jgi:hypothetical protein